MRSDVQKTHQHNHRHRHHHSKHKRQHKDTGEHSADISPVISVPSDSTASETNFPLAKVQSYNSCSESPENSVLRKRRHRSGDGDFEERTGLNSDDISEDEHAKRRRKHKHKEKKRRKHNKKEECDADLDRGRSHQMQEKQGWDTRSVSIRQQETRKVIRVKQEPLSSDEEAPRRHSNVQRRVIDTSDKNGHSIRLNRSLKPDRPIKVEHREHSSSLERTSQSDFRQNNTETRNVNNGSNYEHRDRKNGRVNGETSSISDERGCNSRSIGRSRSRRQRTDEREGNSREHRNDSKPDIRRIKKRRPSDDDVEYEWGKPGNRQPQATNSGTGANAAAGDQKKPNFGLSGKLTEDVNVYNGVVIKYSEPPEARKPKRRWRFYPFKGDETLPTLYIHRQSAYLIGRDRKVADIPVDHPSCSKQHAALQYRLVPFTREDGTKGKRVRPYIIDLESANGTYVNNNRIEPRKYVELMERDVIKFGYSSRDYVLLHEHSKGDEADDDQNG